MHFYRHILPREAKVDSFLKFFIELLYHFTDFYKLNLKKTIVKTF